MVNSGNVPVFLETSLHTCLVVGVSTDDTIGALKRKIVATHPVNFPDIGEIIIQAVKTCRQGKMYHLSESMTVCTLLHGINETLLLYVEAVTAKRKRNLINGKVDEELEVPVRDRIEDTMVNELPHTDKEILIGPLNDLAEATPAHKLNTEKKKRRKISAEDTSMRLESRKSEDELSEVHEELDCMTSKQKRKVNVQANLLEHTPTEEFTSNTIHLYPNEEADHPKCNAQAKRDSDCHDQPDTNQFSNQGTKENGRRTKVLNQSGVTYDIAELLEENGRKDDSKKVQPSEEANQMVSAVLGGVAREKKKRKKTKSFSSDVPSEVPPIRESQSQAEDNINITMEKDSQVPEKPGCTIETPNSIPSQHFKSREEQEESSRAEKDIPSKNQPQNDQIALANDMEEYSFDDARKNVLKESTHVVGEDPGVVFGEKKKHKKSKAAITEISTKELSSRENESCKEKESNSVLEKEISETGAAVFINNAVNANSTAEAVKERSRRKRNKTKASSSDMPSDVLPIGVDDSEKAGDKVHKNNQIMEKWRDSEIQQKSGGAAEVDDSVSCQLGKERLEPEISLPADKDIRFHNQLGIQQAVMADNNEDFGKDTDVTKKIVHVAGEDPGVFSLEKRRRKKKKTEQLAHEAAVNESGQVERNDLILALEAVDADLTKIAGGGHGVAYKGKRKRNKTKAASTDMPPQELSALDNDFSKEGGSKLMLEKNACEDVDNAHLPNNADDVAFLAPNSAGLVGLGERNQTLDSNMIENSVGDGKKKRRRKQEATNARTKATIEGATDEAYSSIKNSVPQTDASGKKELQTKIQKSLKQDNVPANLSSGDKKPSKGKSKEKRVVEKLSNASLADGTIQNAPNTPEKVQKAGDNLHAENHDKEACIDAVETKGSEVLHVPITEKINFIDYFLHRGADQPADTKIAPLKETKGSKKIENSSFSKDSMSASVDTRVSAKTKKTTGKLQTTEKPVKNFKEHNPSGTSNDKSRVHTTMGGDGSKKDDMKHLLDDMAVMSDFSTDDEEGARSQLRRPMAAVQKVASKVIGEKLDVSRKNSAVFSSGLPGDDNDGVGSDASTRDDSGRAKRGSPMPGNDKGRAMMSPSSRWKNERVAHDDVSISQETARPKKTLDLSSVLRS